MKYSSLFFNISISLFLFSCSSVKKNEVTTVSKPNILFIAVDDLRPELNLYGATYIKSPHLDKFAETSTVFNRAYCNVPVCGGSRVSLLTGTRPTRYRFLTARTYKDEQSPETVSLPMIFKNNGYTTISNGKVYHGAKDDETAWDEIWTPAPGNYLLDSNINVAKGTRGMPYEMADVDDNAYRDGKLAIKAIQDLNKLKNSDKPFFLAVGFFKPHLPFTAPKKYWDMYNYDDISLPKNYLQPNSTPKEAFNKFGELRNYKDIPAEGPVSDEMGRKLIQGYYASVSYVDSQIGRVIEELKTLGMDKNTIVVLWGDHGWNLGDHALWCKHSTFKTAINSPLIVRMPGQTKSKRVENITEFLDIYPSLCDLAGIEKPKHLEGESFVSLLKNGERKKDFAISKYGDAIAIVKGEYIYSEWTEDDGIPYARMLFNQKKDPLELDNLAEKDKFKEVVASLSKTMHDNWGKDFFIDVNNLAEKRGQNPD
uniref:sulfatase n=1 Tax=Mariniflexile sp. TaxID=1979402 RepID=UPI0040489B27